MNPYGTIVSEYARLRAEGRHYPLGGFEPAPRPAVAADAPAVLLFSPHPDDECITGGLPLRLLRESKMRIINVAVTLGSRRERRKERLDELRGACGYLGFELLEAAAGGLERVSLQTRASAPEVWAAGVKALAGILDATRPRLVCFPHENDGHTTHIGTHFLVIEALESLPRPFDCRLVETEFWGEMADPNLLVESSVNDVADLAAGLSYHAGEVTRNPYHLLLPAWMQDNALRGTERVGGAGSSAGDIGFATVCRLRRWQGGRICGGNETWILRESDRPEILFQDINQGAVES